MRTSPKTLLSYGAATLLATFVFGYAYFRAKDFLRGPVLEIATPTNGQMLGAAFVSISGTTKNVSSLSLDGKKIFTDENGNWKEQLLLAPGYNIIEARAEDRFGRETKKVLNIVVNELEN